MGAGGSIARDDSNGTGAAYPWAYPENVGGALAALAASSRAAGSWGPRDLTASTMARARSHPLLVHRGGWHTRPSKWIRRRTASSTYHRANSCSSMRASSVAPASSSRRRGSVATRSTRGRARATLVVDLHPARPARRQSSAEDEGPGLRRCSVSGARISGDRTCAARLRHARSGCHRITLYQALSDAAGAARQSGRAALPQAVASA
jgi:hypothetical protein